MSVANIFIPGTTIIDKDYLPNPYPYGISPTLEQVLIAGNDANKLTITNASEAQADTLKCDLIEPGIGAPKEIDVDAEVYVREGIAPGVGVINFELCNGTIEAGVGKNITVEAGADLTLQGTSIALQGASLETSTRLRQTVGGNYALKNQSVQLTSADIETALGQWFATTPTGGTKFGSTYSPELDLYIAVGDNGNFARSTDGVNWTGFYNGVSSNWFYDIVWSPQLSLFVACAFFTANPDPKLVVSSDGITWTVPTSIPASVNGREWYAITWSAELGLFVAIGSDAGTGPALGVVITSPDGQTWTERTAPSSIYYGDVIWVKEMNKFIAVGYGDGVSASTCIISSPDGIVWNFSATGLTWDELDIITYSPELNLLVVTAGITPPGTYGFAISSDGSNWTVINWGFPAERATYIVWLSYYKIFFAVSPSRKTYYSSNGTNWTFFGTLVPATVFTIAVNQDTVVPGVWGINYKSFLSERPVLIGSSAGDTTIQTDSSGAGGTISIQGGTGLVSNTSTAITATQLVIWVNGIRFKVPLQGV